MTDADSTPLLDAVLADLAVESAALDAAVADLDGSGWDRPTPAPGWSILHSIAHLAWTDEVAVAALTDPELLSRLRREEAADPTHFADTAAWALARDGPNAVMARWRSSRAAVDSALRCYPSEQKVPWFGPPMSRVSMATARFMETWAHGVDVTDALGLPTSVSDRIRHVVHLGIRTRDYSFALHGVSPLGGEVFVDLEAPDGGRWTHGSPTARDRISGTALAFALLVTRRRHQDDLDLDVVGGTAEAWTSVAQAYAGDPGAGRLRSLRRGALSAPTPDQRPT